MTNFPRLLAKSLLEKDAISSQAKGAATYTGHISCVIQAAEILVEELGEIIFQQLGLESFSLDYFANTVKLGAYLHDWGKANQHFQDMVYLKSIDPNSPEPSLLSYRKKIQKQSKDHADRQILRHEIISGILALRVCTVRNWLEHCKNANLIIAVWAAMGHHLKVGVEPGKNGKYIPFDGISKIPDGTGDTLIIYTDHADFKAVLKMGSKFLGLPEKLPDFPQQVWQKSQLERHLESLCEEFMDLESQLDWEYQKFTAAVKATVIAADLAGSALPLVTENFKDWMQEVLQLQLSTDEIEQLVKQRLHGKPLRGFQKQISSSSHRVTLVKAGCGTGKTIAAYDWAKNWAVGKRLFFCYPTTGTASQGYIDYANGTEIESTLMHSRADLDRELLFSGDSDDSEEIDTRLSAFQTWRKKLIVCTVDSVLGLIQNNRKPLYAWPAITRSAFVFDEVHAYDSSLFGALLYFLRTFRGAPILLMSASFTPGQLQKIREVMAELGEEIEEPIEGPKELEELKRYQIQYLSEITDFDQLTEIWTPIINALQNKQKVLWVTNSVQTCIDFYRLAKTKLSQHLPELERQLLIYHSRYRYQDRLKKHKAVIDAFQTNNDPVLAITTQVCEMSLDLSADLLISAMAPASSLIQRLGRLNRRMTKPEEGTRLAIIYPWQNEKPYDKTELKTGHDLIDKLHNKTAISQANLSEIASKLGCDTSKTVSSTWLDGHWGNYPGILRQGGSTITVLLEQDLSAIRDAANQRKDKSFMREAVAWAVPIRIPKNLSEWKRKRFYPIAPTDEVCYSEETGAESCK
jgi:CRISPR-associated endonuclease/helicase Cas3